MIQLGISAFYHDAAACIVKNGKVLAAAEEERFTGVKHDSSFPSNAIEWCLRTTKTAADEIDEICWYEDPQLKKDRVLHFFDKKKIKYFFKKRKYLKKFDLSNPVKFLSNKGYKVKVFDHHDTHAAFSYYTSPYDEAAILTVDGVGEWETVTISVGSGNNIHKRFSIDFPHSLGLLYSSITAFLGFKPNEGEYKVMGLAPYGNPDKYFDKLDNVFDHTSNKFYIDQKYFDWAYDDKLMFTKRLCKLLELPPRLPEDELTQEHKDLAAALQKIYEREFLRLVETTKNMTNLDNLCLGGGCAYNGVANSKAYKYFKSIHIPFAPSDAGSAIGACLASLKPSKKLKLSPYLGPSYTSSYVKKHLVKFEDKVKWFKLSDDKLYNLVAKDIAGGKIVAWFQGNMEFGARALGNRSILATPRDPKMREKLNYVIKKREGFRPFAPSVLEDRAHQFFDIVEPVPHMNQVVKAKVNYLPSATHVDGTCRVQTVNRKDNRRYFDLIAQIGALTGIPVVLNTSFNLKDQTITMSPEQALARFLGSKIDVLVINNYYILRNV